MKSNLNRKGIMSLEGLEETAVVEKTTGHDPEALVENELIESQEISKEVTEQTDAISEAEETAEALDGISENMVASVDGGNDGISEPVAQALCAAVEHFQTRLGYQGKARFPAMESFSNKASRVAATKLVIEQNKLLTANIQTALDVAQEGLVDTIVNQFSLTFATEDKLVKRLTYVSSDYDKGTVKTENITAPAWGKALAGDGGGVVTGSAVVSAVAAVRAKFGGGKIADIITETIKSIDEVTAQVRKSTFIADNEAVKAIEAQLGQITKLHVAMMDEVGAESSNAKKPDFAPLEAADKKKLVHELEQTLNDRKVNDAFALLKKSKNSLDIRQALNATTRLVGVHAKDMRQANEAIGVARKIIGLANQLLKLNVSVSHSAISYMAASVGKAAPKSAEE